MGDEKVQEVEETVVIPVNERLDDSTGLDKSLEHVIELQTLLLDRNQQLLEIQLVLLKEIKEGDGLSCESLREIGRILGMVVST